MVPTAPRPKALHKSRRQQIHTRTKSPRACSRSVRANGTPTISRKVAVAVEGIAVEYLISACAPGGDTCFGDHTRLAALWHWPYQLNPAASTTRVHRNPGKPKRRGIRRCGPRRRRHTGRHRGGIARGVPTLSVLRPKLLSSRKHFPKQYSQSRNSKMRPIFAAIAAADRHGANVRTQRRAMNMPKVFPRPLEPKFSQGFWTRQSHVIIGTCRINLELTSLRLTM
jgi:hypothetical protein